MDIDLLVISVGNTRTSLGVFKAGDLTGTRKVLTGDEDAFRTAAKELWATVGTAEDPGVAGASVKKSANDMVQRVIREVADAHVEWVGQGEGYRLLDVAVIVSYQDLCHLLASRLPRAQIFLIIQGRKKP